MNLTGGYSKYNAFIGCDLIANNSNVQIRMDLGFAIVDPTTLNFSVYIFNTPMYFGVIQFITIFI